ncbi:MAG: DUF4389 domain-containing protein [Cypionkella sp.]|nr:DUF4389 domain-containing protein [Cypionkella sp.]
MTTEVNDASPTQDASPRKSVWMRGLYMIITAFLIGAAQSVLFLLAAVQFIMLLIDAKKPNAQIADFGETVGKWLLVAAKFQTGKSDDKPWPLGPLT